MIDMGAIEFGAYLRKARRELDVKQADLALRLGKSQAAISDIERGDRADISREEIEEVLRALVAGRADAESHLRKVIAEGMKEAGFLYSAHELPEIEREPDEEDLQRRLMAYMGDNPVLRAGKRAALGEQRMQEESLNIAGAIKRAREVEESDDDLVHGPRKKISKVE